MVVLVVVVVGLVGGGGEETMSGPFTTTKEDIDSFTFRGAQSLSK